MSHLESRVGPFRPGSNLGAGGRGLSPPLKRSYVFPKKPLPCPLGMEPGQFSACLAWFLLDAGGGWGGGGGGVVVAA